MGGACRGGGAHTQVHTHTNTQIHSFFCLFVHGGLVKGATSNA